MLRSFLVLLLVLLLPMASLAVPVTLIGHDNVETSTDLVKITADKIIIKEGEVDRKSIKKIRWQQKQEQTAPTAVAVHAELSREELIALSDKAKAKYPDAGYITLIDHSRDEYIDEKNQITTYHGAFVIMKDDYKGLAKIASWVNESRYTFEVIYGRIIYPDGTEFYMNPKDLVKSVPKDSGVAFFSNTGAIMKYSFPKPSAGCIVEYKYRHHTFLPYIEDMFDSRYTFNGDQPVISSELEVVMPKGKKLYFVNRCMTEEEAKPTITETDKTTTWYWKVVDQEGIIAEELMPAMGDVTKRMFYANHESMDFIFDWSGKVTAANMQVTPLIEQTVAKILEGVPDTQTEIVRHLYHWVQQEIRYVSIKSGSISGQAGHPADETLRNKYGDCVDKSVLFATMLKVKNVEAYPISLKTNPEAEMETRIPCFDANHSITQVFIDGKSHILDTTATSYSFPYFRSDDHGVPCYNGIKRQIFRTPVPPPEDNISDYTRKITLDGSGIFTVDFLGKYNGSRAAGLRSYYKTVADKDMEKVFIGLSKQDAPDAKLLSFKVNNKEDLFKDISLEYAYSSKEFLKKAGNLYILKNISTLPYTFSEVSLDKRRFDIEYMTTLRRQNNDTYTLSPEWKIKYSPAPIEVKNPYIYYKAEYLVEGNTLTFRNQFDRLKRIVPVADYAQYKKDIQQILDYQKENVILEKVPRKQYGDLLILKDGSELEGAYIATTDAGITYEEKNGEQKTYPMAEIVSLELTSTSGKSGEQSLEKIRDNQLAEALSAKVNPDDFPGAEKVILYDKQHYRLEKDGSYTHTLRLIVQILSEKGKAAGFDNWNYDSEKEEINIDHAYSINDEEVTPLSSRTIKTAMVHSAYPQYQRQKNIKFAMPKIRKGTILDYQVTRKVKSDAFLHPFAVGLSRGSAGDAVSLDAGHNSSWNAAPACFWPVENLLRKELFVEVPTNSDMRITLLNNDSNTITMAKTEKDNYNTYHFYNKEPLIARKNESNLPPISEFVPMVLFSKKVEWPNLHKQLLPLYTETAADRKAAESLLTRLKKEKGKITEEIISNFVALEIEGLPVELRDYDVKPKSIVEIIEKRKASRLDAAWLLVNLLKAAKIDATMAFTINSGFSRDIPMEHPALFYLESPIVRIKNEVGKIHYILPSAPYLNYLDSSVVLEGIDVLVVEKKALITEKIPRTKRSHLSTVINTKLSENGSLSVDTYQTIARGIHQSQFRQLRSVNPKKYPLIAQNVASALHPNAVLKTFDFKNIKELSGQVTLDFTLDIPNYCTRAGNLFFMKLLDVSHFMTRDATPAERLNAGIDLGNGDLVTRQAEYEIPAGFSVYYLPSPRKVETQWFTYRAEITHEGNKLLFNEVTQITDPSIPKEQYSLYQNFRKTMADFSEEYIIFEKQK